MAQWWLATLGGKEFLYLGKLNGQTLFGYSVGCSVFVVDGERLAPVTLTAEDSVAQTVVDLYTTKIILGNVGFCSCYGLFNGKTVKVQFTIGKSCCGRIGHYTLFCIETLLAYVATLDKRTYLNAEMLCKSIVAAVVCRDSHNGSCSVTR